MAKVTSMNDEQIQAVEARNSHILVSAPAGSGKTKILVSRILSILKEGVNIDSFLVLTFTQAAAQEMKQRLSSMLDEEIKVADEKLKDHLMKQKEKMPLAYITNFHGFCNSLISHYGYLVGVQPGYEILSDNAFVLKEALSEAVDQLLSDEEFSKMRMTYFSQRDDLEYEITRLYETLQAVGNREQFIDYMESEVYGFLEDETTEDLSSWCFYPQLIDRLKHVVTKVLVEIEELKLYCVKKGIVAFYDRPLGQKGKSLEKPIPYDSLHDYYSELYRRLDPNLSFRQLNEWAIQKPAATYNIPWKDYGDDIEDVKKYLSSKKSAINKKFTDIYEKLIDNDRQNTSLVHQESRRVLELLLKAVYLTESIYKEKKSKLSVLDFNDLEKYATMLLQEEYPIARELNEKLYEIMVDEYQDTNMVQETIISLISKATEHEVPCFMVGDMKQSIYRFRQADPEIFKNKYDTYPSLTGTKRIDLGFNYRSSKVVLDSINYIFNQIMDEHIGSLEYYRDRSAQLNYDFLRKEGAKDTSLFEEVKQKALNRYFNLQDDTTEVLMVNTSSEKPKDIEDGEYEAWMIGQRILELKGKGLDGKAISYQDIAVLMRQTTKFMTYKKVFDKLNIPTTIVLSSGFMNAVEVRQIVMVLKCLVNPYDDLALMSVLRAPFSFSYFKENEIIAIRHKEYSLYENICGSNKFTSFVNVLEELRALFKKLPFSQWLQCFYEVSGYLNRVAVMKNGVQRYQNLLLLLEKVKEQETEIHDLQSWIDYFEILKESDAAPAVMPKDQEAVVFMTIHKSKGLEFPVVFVAMHDKAFNLRDSKERIIFDRHLTMAIKPRLLRSYETKVFDEPMTYKDVIVEYDNPFLSLLSVNANQETISEEMRVYYVALTRAKSKLILTGCLSEEELNGYVDALIVNQRGNVPEKDEWILNRKIRDGRSYLDWLMPSILVHPKIAPKISEDIRPLQPSLDNTNLAKFSFEWKNYNDIPTETIINEAEIGQGETQLLFDTKDYAYERNIQSSIAVTTLGKENETHVHYSVVPSLPQVMSAADKGTLVHEFMEYLPLENDINIVEVIETLYNEGRYSDIEYQVLLEYKEKLENFISSKAFKFMKEAKMCLREQPFALMQDKQLIHGTFDVLCMNDDVIQVIDYKTDRVSLYSKNEDLVKRHEFQLNLYKQALQTMYPNLQIQTHLYYLEIGRFVEV